MDRGAVEFATLGGTGIVEEAIESCAPCSPATPRRPKAPAGRAAEGWVATYQRWYGPMVRLAGLLVGDFRLGEDLTQDAFARLVEAGDRVVNPVAFVRATVVNLSRSQIRRALVARRHPPKPPEPLAGPEERTDELAARVAVREALRRLPARQREAVVLFYFAQLNETETAAAMGVSAGSVKRHLYRARMALGVELEGFR